MSGTFELAPGVKTEWDGDLTLDKVLENFETQGGQPCWRPHIPGDVQRLLYELGQQVESYDATGKKYDVPASEIPDAGYPEFSISFPTLDDLEKEFAER